MYVALQMFYDEVAKCDMSQCHWPLEGARTRKKMMSSKGSVDNRLSTAGSSASDGSTPQTADHTLSQGAQVPLDVALPPLASRLP